MIRINQKIIHVIFILFLTFAPPILPYSHLLLSIISIFYLIHKTSINEIVFAMKKSFIFNWTIIMIFLLLYAFSLPNILSLITGDIQNFQHYVHLFNRYTVLILSIIPPCTLICIIIKRKNFNFAYIIEVLIDVGLVQAAFSILSYVFPTIKNIFVWLMKKNTGNKLYSNYWFLTIRSYGFASTLVDLFGLGIAIIASLSLFYGMSKKKIRWKYIIYSIIIIIPALLNARTGVLLYTFSIVMVIIYFFVKVKIKKIISILLLGVTAVFLGIYILSKNQATYTWIKDAFTSVIYLMKNKKIGDSGALNLLFTTQSWELPPFPQILIGTGHSLYGANGVHSDIGYINEIWFMGILGCLVMYSTIIYMCIYIFKNSHNITFKFESLFILFAYFIFNFKASAIGYNPGATTMFLFLFVVYFYIKNNLDLVKISNK